MIVKTLVRAAGIEPAQAVRPYGFSYHDGFRRLACAFALGSVRGLDYPFTVAFAKESVRGRCCPSSLYTCPPDLRPEELARDCHVQGFPDLCFRKKARKKRVQGVSRKTKRKLSLGSFRCEQSYRDRIVEHTSRRSLR